MPRQGDGSSDNAIPADLKDIIHGADPVKSTHVDRADKTAEMPEHEKGAGLKGAIASAGDSKGKDQDGHGKATLIAHEL